MTGPAEPFSRIISRDSADQVTVRIADAEGTAAQSDPRLYEELNAMSGQRLSEFSIGSGGVKLNFWGVNTAEVGREILIEQETIEISHPGQPPCETPADSELAAITLLHTLDHALSRVEIDNGRLRLVLDNAVQLDVAPMSSGKPST